MPSCAEAPARSRRASRFDLVHPRDRLVEQKEIGLHGERAHDLHQTLMAVGKPAGGNPRELLADRSAQQLCRLAEVAALAPDGRKAQRIREQRRALMTMRADDDVLEHGCLAQQPDVLKGARDAAPRHPV